MKFYSIEIVTICKLSYHGTQHIENPLDEAINNDEHDARFFKEELF